MLYASRDSNNNELSGLGNEDVCRNFIYDNNNQILKQLIKVKKKKTSPGSILNW